METGEDKMLREFANLEACIREAQMLIRVLQARRIHPSADAENERTWATDIIQRKCEAPSPCEVLVAELSRCPDKKLDEIADEMIAELIDALASPKIELTQLLRHVPEIDPKMRKTISYRFRQRRNRERESFICNDPKSLRRYLTHLISRLKPHGRSGEVPRMIVVDVLSREGRVVLELLEHLIASIKTKTADNYECIVARVIVQARGHVFQNALEVLAHDSELRKELRDRHIYGWFRYLPNAPANIQPATIYGNWISSIPYGVSDHECEQIRQRLWRGAEVDDFRTHDLYFGIHGVGKQCHDHYNHFPVDARGASRAMRETQRQLANIHAHYWAETLYPCRCPDIVEIR